MENTTSMKPASGSRKENITPYDADFENHLIENGIYPFTFRDSDRQRQAPPTNLDIIKRQLARPRASLAPSRVGSIYKEFEAVDDNAFCEQEVMESVVPIIEGNKEPHVYQGGQVWDNLAPLTKGEIKLVKPRPDRFYGSHAHTLLDKEICRELSRTVVPSTKNKLVIVPKFSLEVQGPSGAAEVAKRQACYNGAFGSRAIHSLREYIHREKVKGKKGEGEGEGGEQSTAFDANAYTISSTFQSGTGALTLYTSHPRKRKLDDDQDQCIEQVMTRLGSWCLNHSPEVFQEGVAAYRNARDWAKDQREKVIRQANDANPSNKARPPGDEPRKRRRLLRGRRS